MNRVFFICLCPRCNADLTVFGEPMYGDVEDTRELLGVVVCASKCGWRGENWTAKVIPEPGACKHGYLTPCPEGCRTPRKGTT